MNQDTGEIKRFLNNEELLKAIAKDPAWTPIERLPVAGCLFCGGTGRIRTFGEQHNFKPCQCVLNKK